MNHILNQRSNCDCFENLIELVNICVCGKKNAIQHSAGGHLDGKLDLLNFWNFLYLNGAPSQK